MRTSFFQIAVAAFVLATAASGCECSPLPICQWRTPETAVFVGKVVKGGASHSDRGTWPSHFNEVVLDVIEPFHGVPSNQRQFKLQTMFAKGMCAQTPYFQGDTVLVVAGPGIKGGMVDGDCSPSMRLDRATWELETLRKWNRIGKQGMLVGSTSASRKFELKSHPGGKGTRVTADTTGKFRVLLNPGNYLLPNDPKPVPIGQGQCVGSEYR